MAHNKVVIRTAFKMTIAVLVALLIAFFVLTKGFPKVMANFYESIGNYDQALVYNANSYDRTQDVEELADCVNCAIFADRDADVIRYGKIFLETDVNEYCQKVDGSTQFDATTSAYYHYVSGHVAIAEYRSGNVEEAIRVASNATGTERFIFNNAFIFLSVQVARDARGEQDLSQIAQKIYTAVAGISPQLAKEQGYQAEVLDLLLTAQKG